MLPYERWIGGGAAHLQTFAGELGPAAKAQRKEFKKSAERLRSGAFGFTEGQRQGAAKVARQGVAATQAQQQSDVARMQAAGGLTGGAAGEAQRAVAGEAQRANAAINQQVQQASDQYAAQQYAQARADVDEQAQRWRDLWDKQSNISMQTTQGSGSYSAPAPQLRSKQTSAVPGAVGATGGSTVGY